MDCSSASFKAEAVVPESEAGYVNTKKCADIYEAAEQGNLCAVRHFLHLDPTSLERKDQGDGQTPLHWAAEKGHVSVVELLMTSGASIEAEDAFGRTPLHWAAEFNKPNVLDVLLESGASLQVKSNSGNTALHWAARNGHAAIAEKLITAGAEVGAANHEGNTALHWAARNGHAAVVEKLLTAGAKVDAANNEGLTPLLLAEGRRKVVELLSEGRIALPNTL